MTFYRILGRGRTAGWTIALFVACWYFVAPTSGRAQEFNSTQDGVYSEAQAERGNRKFESRCGFCHQPVQFVGDAFLNDWTGSRVSDLFDFLRYAMPAASHEGYGTDEYIEVIAYMFWLNELPMGETDLPVDLQALEQIRIDAAPEERPPVP